MTQITTRLPPLLRLTGRSSGRQHWPWLRHLQASVGTLRTYGAPAPLTLGVEHPLLLAATGSSWPKAGLATGQYSAAKLTFAAAP